MKCSIIILNYNYGRFLKDTIESCLNQTFKDVETIIIDDGSTDNSREIISEYIKSMVCIFQPNRGMVEASNAGFKKANGEIIIFLDADDYLYENAIEEIVDTWQDGISKIHFRLQKINIKREIIGFVPPLSQRLSEGDVWREIILNGSYSTSPMSGNAYSRSVLENIFPITNAKISNYGSYFDIIPTDAYLKNRVTFFGPVKAIQDALGVYRIHGNNFGATTTPYNNKKKRQRVLFLVKLDSEFIAKHIQRRGLFWKEDTLFRNNKLMLFRILSFRFDGEGHVWKEDTLFSLMKLSVVTTFFRPNSLFRKIYNICIIFLISILSEKLSISLLKVIHNKSFKYS